MFNKEPSPVTVQQRAGQRPVANWQAFAAREQTLSALAEWRQSASTLVKRIETLEASERAKRPRPQLGPQ
jgi:hypothetical protein